VNRISFRWWLWVTIIDWKTGKKMSEDVSMQLSCYAMYDMQKWGVDPDKVKLIEYNLLANLGVEFSVFGAEIENTKTYITGSLAYTQPMLLDVDYNVPKEEEAFQKVKDDRIWSSCNFKKVRQ
jgi:CRISPR/Cas system-associated exonuclease Cas4 (RecB family)